MPGTIRLWFVRGVLALIVALYGMIGWLFNADPAGTMVAFGIGVEGAIGLTTVRIGYGMGFWTLALTALYGLIRPRHAYACLSLLTFMLACVVATRLTGFLTDGVDAKQITELRDEGLSFIVFVAAWLAYPRARLPATVAPPPPTWMAKIAFGLLGLGYLAYGVALWVAPELVESRGMILREAVSLTTVRTGFGAHYIGLGLIAAYGLARSGQRLTCFWFVAVWTVLIMVGRLAGLALDGIDDLQLVDTGVDAVTTVIALGGLWAARRGITGSSA
ncbi:MAG: hypothetical protein SFV21_08445 [Rhodospirillaceae bacterium]|nr:hypothetical protein [Rhodospirillaceae bacterium]